MIHLESFLDRFKKKNNPRYKLANAFVDFFNSVDPELECFRKKDKYGIIVKSRKRTVDDNTPTLLMIQSTSMSLGGPIEYIPITLFHSIWEYDVRIKDFLLDVFGYSQITFEIISDDADLYIEKLTKENYEDFLLKKESDKYNI